MITGRVESIRQAWVTLEMIDNGGRMQPVEVVVDTGFNGYLTLPQETIVGLNLEPDVQTHITLATRVRERVNTWNGFVLWHDQPKLIQILETGGTPLLGMGLLNNSLLTIRENPNGEVLIENLNDNPP